MVSKYFGFVFDGFAVEMVLLNQSYRVNEFRLAVHEFSEDLFELVGVVVGVELAGVDDVVAVVELADVVELVGVDDVMAVVELVGVDDLVGVDGEFL